MPTTNNVGDAVNAIITLTFAGNGLEVEICSVKKVYPHDDVAIATLEFDCLPKTCIMFKPA